ncbi:MAG: hypothetical protein IPH69_16900 [Bacteroidales bacterium]|nr:hypothetical protein [Bacteroidales bacterium]
MTYSKLNRDLLHFRKLTERKNRISIENDHIPVTQKPLNLSGSDKNLIKKSIERIKAARANNKPVMLTFGAHTIKNGMAPVLNALIKEGWVTHLATNGAGIIHDWEFAYQGRSSEDVRENIEKGEFGIWYETGFYINLALITGAFQGLGYGESVGKMISQEGLLIPDVESLKKEAIENIDKDPDKSAAAIDLTGVIQKFNLKPGFMNIPHPFKKYSVQACAYEEKVPFTGHPMFGQDIIYTHPMNNGAAIGRTASADFLCFAESVSRIDGGVYLSLGSAVMSPMIFEKSLSMAQNIEIQHKRHIDNHFILVVDLAESNWDWHKNGEPPVDNPAYYLRYCKTFHRMGGEMHYLTADNRDFLLELYQGLTSARL